MLGWHPKVCPAVLLGEPLGPFLASCPVGRKIVIHTTRKQQFRFGLGSLLGDSHCVPRVWIPQYVQPITSHTCYPACHSDRGTQELKIVVLVQVDRLKWLMHVESYYFRNWNTWPTDSRRWASNSTLCPGGSASHGDGIWAIVSQGGNVCEADKELLINRYRTTRKIVSWMQLLSN